MSMTDSSDSTDKTDSTGKTDDTGTPNAKEASDEATPRLGGGTIVVGVDGSDPSIEALRQAATMAGALGSTIMAVACWRYPPAYDSFVALEWSPETDAAQVLEESLTRAYGDSRPAGLRTLVRQGQPASVLIDESATADMLVVGSRGLGGFSGLLLGSVSAACAAHAHCPVLVVRHVPTGP
jgi:nucleotide-binding universal stress UspA family protein